VASVYNSKNEPVKYAKAGENIQLRLLNIDDENKINKGDVLTKLNEQVPITDLFEAEVDVLELLSYKPILSKGYQCILHIHTVADEATIKDIIVAYEKNDKGETIEKIKPQFTKSFSKMTCRIQTRVAIPVEKSDTVASMGRFTLRDEGKTIAVGKILKYKPVKVANAIAPTTATNTTQA
jgi:peptide chain release factor subunit 3